MKTDNQAKESAIGMSQEVLSNSQDLNNVITTSQTVKAVFHTHYVNLAQGDYGIKDLLTRILREHEACFPKGIETGELRKVAIAGAMFTSEVISEVQSRFTAGSIRYPVQTIKAYLSVFMFKSGQVGKIQLSNAEDKERECCKPRCKWYLIETP